MSQPRYPNPIAPARAMELLRDARAVGRHKFWPCDLSVLDEALDPERLHGPRQVTDAYLLALAVAHGGRLVTLDRGVPGDAVVDATSSHLVVL